MRHNRNQIGVTFRMEPFVNSSLVIVFILGKKDKKKSVGVGFIRREILYLYFLLLNSMLLYKTVASLCFPVNRFALIAWDFLKP